MVDINPIRRQLENNFLPRRGEIRNKKKNVYITLAEAYTVTFIYLNLYV